MLPLFNVVTQIISAPKPRESTKHGDHRPSLCDRSFTASERNRESGRVLQSRIFLYRPHELASTGRALELMVADQYDRPSFFGGYTTRRPVHRLLRRSRIWWEM